jgi:ATP-dependent DNA helicase RecG
MDDSELEQLLAEIESDRVERKESISDGEKIRQAVCAFANDLPNHQKPGIVFIGVNDKGGCTQLPITDQLLQTLAGMKADGNISPFPSMIVQKKILNGCELAVVLVHPSDAPPVYFKGTPWIRVGPRRSIATSEELRRLAERRKSKDLPFDLYEVTSATLADLDLEFFRRDYLPATLSREVLENNDRTIEDQLNALRFVAGSEPLHPTVLVQVSQI